MTRRVTTAVALVVLLAACGGGVADAPTEVPTTADPATSAPTTAGATDSGSPATTAAADQGEDTTSQPDGPAAPDFTLALGDGGSFTLSAEQKPVYLVFWAEW